MAISEPIFTIGSCFADSIANRMASYKLNTSPNPSGILYNPVSIHGMLAMAAEGMKPAADHYTSGEVVHHYDFHSLHAASSQQHLAATLQDVLSSCNDKLAKAEWLIITYGTTWVYRHKGSGRVVANCHKQPASAFVKELLTADEITASFHKLIAALRAARPTLKVILTISPVRHLKDTLEGNSISKAVLRVACNNIVQSESNVYYFPAYEIMMDDLRDYRFYKADMIHPNELAEDYIWEKFSETWFDDDLLRFLDAWKSIKQALKHRPFHAGTKAHQQFLRATLQRVDAWKHFVNVDDEREQLLSQMKSPEHVGLQEDQGNHSLI